MFWFFYAVFFIAFGIVPGVLFEWFYDYWQWWAFCAPFWIVLGFIGGMRHVIKNDDFGE